MLTLIVLLVVSVVLFVVGYLCDFGLLTLSGFVCTTALCICLLSLINIGSRFQVTIEKYNNLKTQVETYNNMPDSCRNVSFEFDIRRDVVRMNNEISQHKVMSKSPWVNLWHSKEIGDLPKLELYTKSN